MKEQIKTKLKVEYEVIKKEDVTKEEDTLEKEGAIDEPKQDNVQGGSKS